MKISKILKVIITLPAIIKTAYNQVKAEQALRKTAKALIQKDGTIKGVYINGEPMKIKRRS